MADFEDRSPHKGVREFGANGREFRFIRDTDDDSIWLAYEKRGGGFGYAATVECASGEPRDLHNALLASEEGGAS